MFQGIFKSAINDANKNYIFGTGSIPINIKTAQLATFADGTTKQQGYQVSEVSKLISTMLTGWDADGNKPKSMSDNYLEIILSCDNGFVVKKRLQFPHIIAWQNDDTPYNIADVYKEFSIDNWLKADDFENPDITLVVEPTDEILTTSTATPPEATTEQSGRFYLYYRNLPVGINRVHIDFHIKAKTEPIDFDLEVADGLSWKDAQVILASNEQAKINILLSGVKDVYKFTGAEGNFEDITMHEWNALYQQIISLKPNNKFTHDLFFYIYDESELNTKITELNNILFDEETITDISKVDGRYYNLINKTFVKFSFYFTSEVDIPDKAVSLEMRFEKSTGGGIGVEFRDSNGNVTGTFSNMTEPRGTKIRVSIPSGTTSIIFSYLNSIGASYEKVEEFDGITFYTGNGLVDRVETLEKGSGNVLFYLSEDTGTVLQDSLTLEELYGGYDELCELYPNYIKRIDDIGTASDGNPIRQYRIGYNKLFFQEGEGNYPEKNADNLWNEGLTLNKILINAGTHGDEKAPCYATMLAFKDLIKSTEPWAMRIKSNVTIYVCPTLNPYGFQNRTLANANGVNINRDIASQTQPESIAWKTWIDAHTDAIAYIDIHGVDLYTPFLEPAKNASTENLKKYAHIAYKLASDLKSNWDGIFVDKGWCRPYLLKSTYDGTTINYTESIGIKGFIVETPCDVISNQYNPAPNYFKSYSKSNKMTKDMLINIIDYFISNK